MGMNFRALAISLALAFAIYFTYGQFVLEWITILPLIFALSISSFKTHRFFEQNIDRISCSIVILFLVVAGISLLPPEPLRSIIVDVATTEYLVWMRGLYGLAAALTLALGFYSERRWSWILFAAILCTLTVIYSLMIPSAPKPQIDVWTLHEQASNAFAHFQNPYTIEYDNIYPKELWPTLTPFGVNFAYLPGVFMWMAPFKALGLDTRASQIFANLLTAILLFLICNRPMTCRSTDNSNSTSEIHQSNDRGSVALRFLRFAPALIFYAFPLTMFFLVRGWNDDIPVLFFTLAAYALLSRRAGWFFIACNGFWLSKQYAIIFAPFLIYLAIQHLRLGKIEVIIKSSILAALVGGAFLILDWRNFLGSLYGLHFLKHPAVHQAFPDRRDSYSLMNFLHLNTGLRSSWFFLVVVFAIALVVFFKNRRKPQLDSYFRGFMAMAFGMILFAPVAFANYYEFALGLVVTAWAVQIGSREERVHSESSNLHQQSSWEFEGSAWTLAYVVTRSLIFFLSSWFAFETMLASKVSESIHTGLLPYTDFNYFDLPSALLPTIFADHARQWGDMHEFLSFHWLFRISVFISDAVLALVIFRRHKLRKISRASLATFVLAPLFIAPYYLSSSAILSACFFILLTVSLKFAFARVITFCRRHEKIYFRVQRFGAQAQAFIFGIAGLAVGFAFYTWIDIQPDSTQRAMALTLTPTSFLVWWIALAAFLPRKVRSKVAIWFERMLQLVVFCLTAVILAMIERAGSLEENLSSWVLARNLFLLIWLGFIAFAFVIRTSRREI